MVRKQKKKRSIPREVHQAYYENMAPIYETINCTKIGNSSSTNRYNFGIMTSGDVYGNIHSRETKCCQNVSPKIDTTSNVAYMTLSREIPMQNNDSYQVACTITQHSNF